MDNVEEEKHKSEIAGRALPKQSHPKVAEINFCSAE